MKCRERIAEAGGWHFHQCTREAVDDGLCRMHLTAKRKREATVERKTAERNAKHALANATAAVLEAVAYEVEHSGHHDHPNGTTRGCELCTTWKNYRKALNR